MSGLILLRDLQLIPVLELEPWQFSIHERPLPSGSAIEMPEAWGRYWHACLADSGITGLIPLYPGSRHVLVRELDGEETLLKILRTLLREEGSTEAPADDEDVPALDGGLALFSQGELLVEPTCCSDLGNLSEWRSAAAYRDPEWRILWIGHP